MTTINASLLDTSPPEYLVEGMLPDMGTGFFYGGSYIGKSLVAIELCLAIANGTPFFGHETTQGAAVWGIGEGLQGAGPRVMARLVRERTDRRLRAAGIAARDGQDAADEWLGSLPPYTDERMFVRTAAFNLPFTAGTPGEPTEELRQAATEWSMIPDLRLAVLDTARRFSSLSLSNGTSANRFMQGMSWLAAQLQCTVLAIAHPVSKGRNETGLPGDTLYGASDFVWFGQAAEDSTADAPRALIIAEKLKDGTLFKPMSYSLQPVQWRQPPTDRETGAEIPGAELIVVRSATVRQDEDPQDKPDVMLAPAARRPLPEAEEVPSARPRRRTGIRPAPVFRPVGTSAPAPEPEDPELEKMITSLLAVQCPVDGCGAMPGDGCRPTQPYVMVHRQPLVLVHTERMDAAVSAELVALEDVLAQFPEGAAPPQLTGTRS